MNRSLLLVLAGAAALVVLFFVFRDSGEGSSSEATTATTTTADTATGATTTTATTTAAKPQFVPIRITVKDARPVGGIHRQTVKQGENVHLIVTSDTVDEVHLHGYDIRAEVEQGRAELDFRAKIAGRFEAELEQHGVQILDLEVQP